MLLDVIIIVCTGIACFFLGRLYEERKQRKRVVPVVLAAPLDASEDVRTLVDGLNEQGLLYAAHPEIDLGSVPVRFPVVKQLTDEEIVDLGLSANATEEDRVRAYDILAKHWAKESQTNE